jgi:RNA polymerase sigma factor (sigma-70 family)
MSHDAALLRRYAEEHSESAFAELIQRNVDVVYSAALRVLNSDVHRAQDVTQQVFAELARQARRLVKHPALVGWLYTTTRQMALRVVRTEQRRKTREREATMMNEPSNATEPEWERMQPMIEEAMHELGERDRIAVLMRFFQGKPLRDVGAALGLNENAARMRVERALEKLRTHLAGKGVVSTGTLLASTLAGHAVVTAPSAFVSTLAGASLTAAAASGPSLTLLEIMAMSKLKFSVIGLLMVAGVSAPLILHHEAQARLRDKERALQEQEEQVAKLAAENERLSGLLAQSKSPPAPRLPAPPLRATQRDPGDLQYTNLYSKLTNEAPKLTSEQVEAYVQANRRNASSLLAAYRTSGSVAWLEEAMQKYPNDPQVAFEAAYRRNAPPQERRQWLDVFKKSAPDNSLAYYLSAFDYFKAGQSDQGVQELVTASGKHGFDDYTLDRMQDDEEAYRAAGYSVVEAKTIPSSQLLLPQLFELKQLSGNLLDLAKSYEESGDAASAQAALQMAMSLGQRYSSYSPGEPEVSRLVGLAVERNALTKMDPDSPYGNDGQTVKDRLDQIVQYSDTLRSLNSRAESLFPQLSEQDWISYKDRWRVFGEQAALRWVIDKYGSH